MSGRTNKTRVVAYAMLLFVAVGFLTGHISTKEPVGSVAAAQELVQNQESSVRPAHEPSLPHAQKPYKARHSECVEALGIARKAGWPNWSLSHLEPIMWRETTCKYNLKNKNTNGTTDWGLMQINDANVEMLVRKGIIRTKEDLFNPYVNLKASLAVYKFFGNSFCAWQKPAYCSK